MTLSLAYNPSLLTITAATGENGGTATLDTTSTSGLALITFTDSSGLVLQPSSDLGNALDFVHLTASVPSEATYGTKEILDLQSININQGTYTSTAGTALDDAAIHAVGFLGDTAMEGQYGVTNALYAAQVAVSLQTGFKDWAMVDPIVIGNVTGDGQVSVDDALFLAEEAVSITPNPNPFPSIVGLTPTINGPDPLLSVPTTFTATAGSSLVVPVNLSYSAGLDAVNLALSYDTSRLVVTAADVERGSLTAGFDDFVVNVDQATGVILITGYRSAGPITGDEAGSLALIRFQVKADAPDGVGCRQFAGKFREHLVVARRQRCPGQCFPV